MGLWLYFLTLRTSSCVDLQLVKLVTSVTEPPASTAIAFTGTDTGLPVSTAVFKISVFCAGRGANTQQVSDAGWNSVTGFNHVGLDATVKNYITVKRFISVEINYYQLKCHIMISLKFKDSCLLMGEDCGFKLLFMRERVTN